MAQLVRERGRWRHSEQLQDPEKPGFRRGLSRWNAARGFGELGAVGFHQHRHVSVAEARQAQCSLQVYLSRSVAQQIGSPHHVGHALRGIIDDHRQQIRKISIAAPQNGITGHGCHVLGMLTLQTVDEPGRARFDPQPRGGGGTGISRTAAARPGIAFRAGEVLPAAGAFERQAA
jgi:hypothetical protein